MALLRSVLLFVLEIAITAFAYATCSFGAGIEPGFVIHQSITLTQKSDGIDGSLAVLRDARLSESDLQVLAEHDPDNDLSRSTRFANEPIRSARLVLKVQGGRMTWIPLEKPYAHLEAMKVDFTNRAILVTQDFGIGFGSYNGPLTKILSMSPNSMHWAMARGRRGRKIEISLMRSLKSAWNFTLTSEGKDILAIDCCPDKNLQGFITNYTRFHWSKEGWLALSRRERGAWEAEDGDQALGTNLPNEKKFPRIVQAG